LASVGSSRSSPASAGQWVAMRRAIASGPRNQALNGGISQTTSAVKTSTIAATSLASMARA
jgi:hypothetical protein